MWEYFFFFLLWKKKNSNFLNNISVFIPSKKINAAFFILPCYFKWNYLQVKKVKAMKKSLFFNPFMNEAQLVSILYDKYFCLSSSILKAINYRTFKKLTNKSDYVLCLNLFTYCFSKNVRLSNVCFNETF